MSQKEALSSVPVTSAPLFGNFRYWAIASGRFASVQVIVQIIGFFTGILVVRRMAQQEYAFYTIASAMQGTMSLLADMGISTAVMALGGKVWQDRVRLGEVIETALRLRYWLATGVVLVVAPAFIWLLLRQGASLPYALLLLIILLSSLVIQLSTNIFVIVPRLHAQVGRLQHIDLLASISRLVLIGAACLIWINSGTAMLAASITALIQFWILRRWIANVVDLNVGPTQENRREMLRLVRSQALNTIYYCFQGQITVWIITTFGKTQSIAEVGALGRLALLFTVMSSVMGGIVIPRFARCQDPRMLLRRYRQIISMCSLFALVIVAAALLFTPQFLWLLGERYQHLHTEFLLMILSTVLTFLTGTMWSLNAARAWLEYSWLYMPSTLVTQIVLLMSQDVSSVSGVILFGLYSAFPFLLLNVFMTFRGFRAMPQPL